ncbi:TetR/AcrR family transcriptional regulator [Bacillaceae bacterium IKA-2]|nr:TetR/AcrR family transcriptional regulator [Bacillaceae bacterium IKA-2]
MSGLTPRKLKALETKKNILSTALKLFSEKGYDNVTIDDIATKSGTSKGAFYNHFHSKYEIFLEKFKEIDEFYISYSKELEKETTEEAKLISLFHAQLSYLESHLGKDVIRTIYINGLIPNHGNFLSNKKRPYYGIVKNIVETGQKSGEFHQDFSPEKVTDLLTRTTRGSLYDWCSYEDFALREEGMYFLSLIIRGLRKS